MADRLKGITLEIGGDTTSLSKSLKGVNSDIKSTQAQLKDVERLLKLDPSNVELLRQKQQLLKTSVEQTTQKLEKLKEAQATMDANGVDKNSEQYMALQREIASTEIDLNRMQDAAADANATLRRIDDGEIEDVANAAEDAADSLNDAGKEAADFGDVLKAGVITEAAGRIVDSLKNVAEETKEYRKIMASTEVSSQRAGYSAGETEAAYRKLYGVLADDQSAATTLANLQALQLPQETLLQLIDSTIGAWAAYGDSIPIDGLAESVNETIRAGQVTGTFADVLNWGAREGETYGVTMRKSTAANAEWNASVAACKTAEDYFNLALSQCRNETERTNLIMAVFADQGLSAVGKQWQQNNATLVESNEAHARLQEQLAILGETIEPLITMLVNAAAGVLEWFNNLNPALQGVILGIVLLVATIGPIAAIFVGIKNAVNALIPSILVMNAAFAANPYLLLAVAIAAAIGVVAYAVISNFETIKAYAAALWDFLKAGFQNLVDTIVAIAQVLGIALMIPFKLLWELGKAAVNAVLSMVEYSINGIIARLNGLISVVNSVISALASLAGVSFGGFRAIGNVELPRLAKGGTVSSGTAMVGEEGPELLTVAGGRATVTPLTATVDGKSMAALTGSQQIRTTVDVRFSGSLSQLAAVLQPAITAETQRIGGSFTK